MRATQSPVLTRSKLALTPKYAASIDETIPSNEKVLIADDTNASIFEFTDFKLHFDLVAVLTEERLVLFRKAGMLGAKKPHVVPLKEVTEIGTARQGGVFVQSEGEYGRPGGVVLELSADQGKMDLWSTVLHDARQNLRDRDLAARGSAVSSELEELRRLQGN